MTVQPRDDIEDDIEAADRVDRPARTDRFVAGLSEAIGGPTGDYAVRRDGPMRAGGRFWSATRIVLALTCLMLALHWVQKSPCQDGAWVKHEQYTKFCYTDVLALYYAEHLNEGAVPYLDYPVEYPVLTGAFMGALGLPIHNYAQTHPEINQGRWFYNANALVLGALAVATVGLVLGLRRRRPWDAALFALSPALLVTATVNWDLLAIALATGGMYAWARRRPVAAGVLLGLGGAAKLWPLFIFWAILWLGLRAGQKRAAWTSIVAGAITVLAVNLPVIAANFANWNRFMELNRTRAIDWGTLWYIGRYLDSLWNSGAAGDRGPFQWLSDHVNPQLNWLTYGLFGLGAVAVAFLAVAARRRPRLAQLAFLLVAVFLLTSKVWSQQFNLWLLVLAVLARPRWGAFLAWQVAEVLYFFSFYGELLGASGRQVFPEGVFVLAASLRWITVAVLCGYIVHDILHPDRDPVRQTYSDDPDGGVLDGAPDAQWVGNLAGAYKRKITASVVSSRWMPRPSTGAPSATCQDVPVASRRSTMTVLMPFLRR